MIVLFVYLHMPYKRKKYSSSLHTVEYTDVVVMEGQIQVTISYDKYIQLTDNELLVPWSGLDPNN